MADKKAKIPIDFFFREEVESPTEAEIEAEKEFEPPLEEDAYLSLFGSSSLQRDFDVKCHVLIGNTDHTFI